MPGFGGQPATSMLPAGQLPEPRLPREAVQSQQGRSLTHRARRRCSTATALSRAICVPTSDVTRPTDRNDPNWPRSVLSIVPTSRAGRQLSCCGGRCRLGGGHCRLPEPSTAHGRVSSSVGTRTDAGTSRRCPWSSRNPSRRARHSLSGWGITACPPCAVGPCGGRPSQQTGRQRWRRQRRRRRPPSAHRRASPRSCHRPRSSWPRRVCEVGERINSAPHEFSPVACHHDIRHDSIPDSHNVATEREIPMDDYIDHLLELLGTSHSPTAAPTPTGATQPKSSGPQPSLRRRSGTRSAR